MSETLKHSVEVVVVGAGFTGLSAAYELAKQGVTVTVLEAEPEIGGLAGAFDVGGAKLDKFYHHWFTNDVEVMSLIEELGLGARVVVNPTATGVYYANSFFKLSTPMDLLKFSPLSFWDRLRLGVLALRARRVVNWKLLEGKTAQEWLLEMGGDAVYRIVWQPLLKGKFGPFAEQVSAVWFWNKLKLRGGSRGSHGEERLAYLKGGFIGLANSLAEQIRALGGAVLTDCPVSMIQQDDAGWLTSSSRGMVRSDRVVVTTPLPVVAEMVRSWASVDHLTQLERIKYIGNVCLVLELDRPLSSTYWLNVNDPSFPFVGVIEHTNFENPDTYGGKHIVYLSKYLPHTERQYAMTADELLDYALPYLKRMFPEFRLDWVSRHHLWRAQWSQPVVECHYSQLIPEEEFLANGFHICTMAQIYPEDRGTNYAIREGRNLGRRLVATMSRDRT